MSSVLMFCTTVLAIVVFSTSFAHALEFPGKLRLDRDAYCRTQTIYYPGFTVGGLAEPVAVLAAGTALAFSRGVAFKWILTALVALAAVHAVYWIMTHPVNRFWMIDEKTGRAGAAFFGTDKKGGADAMPRDWRALR